ncbi:uncharacterized protein L969DRAFT_94956 [Mixia osmundae IAM 14324]|uniref:Uncharacterized protein n=1 Tax=Mixia osmundae (strain CBS 9802 / IAM 14324 / JCM 22182 / KY 12970) TaxID=764103 RepID=G7E173_MIXOS|nr:uncharacterized protein L969DRAFT_94956 [Mixia osmundae IAM 14324]KEI38778.1 hypothetical protein L969DRAFT_94956 [Mixia osmundae IAM 14324]GAA96583.1 hypothetical protein E5Q_03253 [Mixia osmundae IAM 14324]
MMFTKTFTVVALGLMSTMTSALPAPELATSNAIAKRGSLPTTITIDDGAHTPYKISFGRPADAIWASKEFYETSIELTLLCSGWLALYDLSVGDVHTTGFGSSTNNGDAYQTLTFEVPVSPTEYIFLDVNIFYQAAPTDDILGYQILGGWIHGSRLDLLAKNLKITFQAGSTLLNPRT